MMRSTDVQLVYQKIHTIPGSRQEYKHPALSRLQTQRQVKTSYFIRQAQNKQPKTNDQLILFHSDEMIYSISNSGCQTRRYLLQRLSVYN